MTAPAISIVTAVRNRADNLARLLERLTLQRGVDRADFEVIVDDDGSSDGTREVAARFASRLVLRITGPDDPAAAAAQPFRSAVGRNRAMAAARGETLLILDGDVIPGPFVVQAHLERHHGRPGELAVAGAMAGYPHAIEERGPEHMQAPPPDELIDRLPGLLMADPARWADHRSGVLARWPGLVGCPFGWLMVFGFNLSFSTPAGSTSSSWVGAARTPS
jgi:glycosyltransferase involved in cell wall biosynthesis